VRAVYSRRLVQEPSGPRKYLWPEVAKKEPIGSFLLSVSASANRKARSACMQLQVCPVTLDLVDEHRQHHRFDAPVWAVRAVEVGTTPPSEPGIEWLLLTTHPVENADEAMLVVYGYATRWRIEEFHKVWKTGACRVEQMQLRDRDHVERWATILSSVAMRILRLTYLARTQPDLPATVELSRTEIEAVIRLRKPKGVTRDATPTIGDATRWLADLGGYTGKSSGGPPGAIVIARGLADIRPVVQLLDDQEL
jgi:hypothetical protein